LHSRHSPLRRLAAFPTRRSSDLIWGKDNVQKSILIEKGDPDQAFAAGGRIIEGEYRTSAQEQLYIEPNGIIARFDEEGITVWGRSEEHTSELQSRENLVCRLLLE